MVLHTIERLYVKANPKLEGTDDLPLLLIAVLFVAITMKATPAELTGLTEGEMQADGVLREKQ